MNVGYNEINTTDAAKILGVDRTTVTSWCKNNVINFQDVSGAGSKTGRYLIPEYELDYLKKLFKKYGKRKAMKNYEKNRTQIPPKKENTMNTTDTIPWILDLDTPIQNDKEEHPIVPLKGAKNSKLDPDKIMKTLYYIQDIKDRLNDLEAEKNQLLNEYEQCKQEIMDLM